MDSLDRQDLADGLRESKKPGWALVSYRSILIILMLGANGYFWLYADSHNDVRYVKLEDYKRDQKQAQEAHDKERASDADIEALREGRVADKMSGMEKWLSEISGDVKEILKESRNK